MVAVSIILLVVGLTSRFIQYLGQAVAGELASDVLLLLMFYRLPDFFLVILPLAFFLGIQLAYGRMYADNEMVVLFGAGFSQLRLTLLTLAVSLLVLLLVAVISLSVAPWGVRNTERLKQSQEQLTEIDLIVPGQFQSFSSGGRVTYAESARDLTAAGRQLQNVFVALSEPGRDEGPATPRIVLAETAEPFIDPASGARFMRLRNVLQYEGIPGQADFTVARFAVQSILLPEATEFEEILEEETLSTAALVGSTEPAHQAELQWRLSSILLIPIITLIAIPLSKVNPRQGRFSKLVPAALIYAAYYLLLQYAREQLAEGSMSATIGLWWVHLLFLLAAALLFALPRLHWPSARNGP